MYLYEYESREILTKYGIPVEEACIASNLEEAKECLERIPPPYVIKAQIRRGGRGKLGGIKIAHKKINALNEVSRMLGSTIGGFTVRKVLISEKLNILRETYLSYTIDKGQRSYVLLASPHGGIDVEEMHRKRPESLLKVYIDPLLGLKEYMVRKVVKHLGLDDSLASIVRALYNVFIEYNCELVEVNPLAITDRGVFAVDRRIIIDDSYAKLAPTPSISMLWERYVNELSEEERMAINNGFSYVELEGDIGVLGNGAGLTMATLDLVKLMGGKPGAFLDIGGGASSKRVKIAMSLLLKNKDLRCILVNVIGGITRCDEVAKGIVGAIRESGVRGKKIVVRLLGLNEKEGKMMLAKAGINVFEDLLSSVKEVVSTNGACE